MNVDVLIYKEKKKITLIIFLFEYKKTWFRRHCVIIVYDFLLETNRVSFQNRNNSFLNTNLILKSVFYLSSN